MTLLLRTWVVVAVLVVSTTATPPSNYNKKPDNDKNPPSYRYKYTIEDHAGDGHGKAEAREGEQASGRYYVNSKRSLTDVKYIADEWGYHPFVQYGSSDNHSSSATTFAIGEKAVVNLPNKNIAQRTADFLQPGERLQLVKIVQPYHRSKQNAEASDIFFVRNNETWNSDEPSVGVILSDTSLQSNSNSAPVSSLNVNYMNNIPQYKLTEETPPSNKKIYIGQDHQLSAMQQQSNFVSSLDNDLPSTISEEDQLVIDNAGNFGQRLYLQNKDTLISSATTSTASPISTHSDTPLTSSTIPGEHYFQGIVHKKSDKPYLPNIIPGLGAYSSTTFPFLDNSVTANSIEFENAQRDENNGIDNVGWRTHSVSSNRVTTSNFGTTRNPILTNYASQKFFSNIPKVTNVATNKKKEYGFSKPIVVPDVPKENPFQYSTTFECEDTVSSTPDPIHSKKDTLGDTTSSYILNPIQAGVSLINAGETHLITNDVTHNKTLPAPVKEKVQEASSSSTIQSQEKNYLGAHIAYTDEKNISQSDQVFEIQKSVEINQNNAAQGIQNSEKLMTFPKAKHIDPKLIAAHKDPQQQLYFTNSAELNSKKTDGGRTRSETLTKIYEFTDIYPRDLSDEKPIYVIPPATYIIEDSSILKNSLLQEKVQQYQEDISDSKIKSDEQRIQIETQKAANTKPFRSLDTGASYDIEILHEPQKIIPTKLENNFETNSEKAFYIPHVHPIGKIIEKKIPYQIEKIIENKIPIPQPYPISIQPPVPQPIPIHIEKVVERKIPVSVHIPIPHPYPIDKQIHIPVAIEKIVEKQGHIPINVEKIIEKKVPVPQLYPVEIEKIVERKIPYPIEITKYIEKPVTMQAPYGVQYGVSYQQIMKPQNHGLYSHQLNKLGPLYALSISPKNPFGSNGNNITKSINDVNVNNFNHSQFQGYIYDKPSISFNEGKENIEKHQFPNSKAGTKIFTYNSFVPPYSLSNAILHRRYTDMQRSNKPERDDYFGPVPPPHHVQRQFGFQSKAFASYPITADRTQNSRKSRNYEPVRYQKGNFRQSKIEYGFKPPMVPSVQYDEETASKVER